ncbi:uncharacterized protein LOC123503198 [Portunus trituberculatus]|nr:uncharacterized protein LOC123503198 [Portunus trituberculatus]
MNHGTAVKTGAVFGVYMTVSIFFVYMDMKKPCAPIKRTNESQRNTKSLEVTWAESGEKVVYSRTNKWHVFNKYTEIVHVPKNIDNTEEEEEGREVQYDYFRSERVKRIEIKPYIEILKDRFSKMKKFSAEDDFFIPSKKMLRKRVHLNQSNAYDELIHLITLSASQTVSREIFSSLSHIFLLTNFNKVSISNPTVSFPLHFSSTTASSIYECLFVSHSSSTLCKKKTKYCVEPIALKYNLQISDIQTEGPSHLNVNKANFNEYPLIGNCQEVIQRQGGRLGEKSGGVIENVRKDRHTDVCIENLKTPMKTKKIIDERKNIKDIRISLTVDARSSFLQDVNGQHFPRSLVLDLLFDLAGLNSLHKHDIIASLVQVMQQRVAARGYQLVASSAKGGDLLQYLHQEGLPPPLLVHTFWRRPPWACSYGLP